MNKIHLYWSNTFLCGFKYSDGFFELLNFYCDLQNLRKIYPVTISPNSSYLWLRFSEPPATLEFIQPHAHIPNKTGYYMAQGLVQGLSFQNCAWPAPCAQAFTTKVLLGKLCHRLTRKSPCSLSSFNTSCSYHQLPITVFVCHIISYLSQCLLSWANIFPEIWSLGRTSLAIFSWICE